MVATSGVALSRMTCLVAGHSIMGIGSLADCCPEEPSSEEPAFRAVCCAHVEAGGMRAVTLTQDVLCLDPVLYLLDGAPVLVVPVLDDATGLSDHIGGPPPEPLPDRLARSGVYRI